MGTSETGSHPVSNISRRAFLAGAASVAAVTVLPVATAERAMAVVSGSGPLKRSTFTPLLHSSFQMVDTSGRSLTVVLSQVNDLKPVVAPGSETRFGLVFEGPLSAARPQGTYRLRHSRIGEVLLFVVPVDRAVRNRQYEAIIFQK